MLQDTQLDVEAFTQELRIASNSNGPFRWLIGGFYQDRDTTNFLDIILDDGTGQPVEPAVFALQSRDVGTSESWGIFGSASYDISPTLEFTLGARYDSDKRNSVDQIFAGSDASDKFTSFQPKVQLKYELAPSHNIYATYSEGFGSGGFNAFFAGPAARRFAAQSAENYEIGAKGEFGNGLVQYSASLFQVYYDNQQFYFITTNPPSQNITNIDRTRVNGLELEVSSEPFENFNLSMGLGITDSKILQFDREPSSEGNRSPQNNSYTFNLSGQYTIPLNEDYDLRLFASYRRQGEQFWDAANTLRTEPKDFINMRLALEGVNWSLTGFVNNLTNDQYPLQASANAFGPGLSIRNPSERRTYGIEGRISF